MTPQSYLSFLKKGGKIEVLYKTHLIAVTVNPISPHGYVLDSNELCKRLSEQIGLPVFNVKELES